MASQGWGHLPAEGWGREFDDRALASESLPDRHGEGAHGREGRDRRQWPAGVFKGDDPCAQVVEFLGGLFGAVTEQGVPSLDTCVCHVEATA